MSRHLGLDLGGTNIKTAILTQRDGDFAVDATAVMQTGAGQGPDIVVENLVSAGRAAIAEHGAVDTVGLGVPGLFDRDTGEVVLFPNLPGDWVGYPLRSSVADGLGLPTWMVNDARAFTLAEGILGAGRGCAAVACITLGTGVGGGIMIDGRLHRGAFGVAGEIGHQTIEPDGPVCGCGNRGCVEALIRSDVFAEMGGKSSVSDVLDAARSGEQRSRAAVERVAEVLGIGLANVVTLLGPDRIVVGGGIAEAGDLILGPIAAAVKARVTLVPTDQIEVVPAVFGMYGGAVGAALAGALRP